MKLVKAVSKVVSVIAVLTLAQSVFAFSRPSDVIDDEAEPKAVAAEESAKAEKSLRVGVLSGPSGMTMAYQMENGATVGEASASYEVFAGAALLLPKLIKGEIDIGFLPPNVAAKVYNANNGAVRALAVAGNGMMSLITKDKAVKSVKDLAGKTVSVAGQGATPDYMMRYLLKANNTEATLDFSIPNAEIAPALIAGKIEYAVVPEPFATVAVMKDSEITRAVNIQDEFASASGTDGVFPMTLVVVNAEFAKNNADTVASFLASYEKSAAWTLENPADAGALVEKNGIGLKSAVAAAAIPNAAFTFKKAKDAQSDIEKILSVFLDFEPTSIGGKLPDDGFYY